MGRWQVGEADMEALLRTGELQRITGPAAEGSAGLMRSARFVEAASNVLGTDPAIAFVLAYDAVRHAATAVLAQQGLRPTSAGGHVAVERAVRAQFGSPFAPYGGMRRRRHDVEYPSHPEESVDRTEAEEAVRIARELLGAAERLMPHLEPFD